MTPERLEKLKQALRTRQDDLTVFADGVHKPHNISDESAFSRTLFEWAHPRIAARCRKLGRPYPPLDGDGDILCNPFAAL